MRILVVDDGKAGDDFAHHMRAMYGAETFRAHSLADGLAKRIEIKDLDFVVLDLLFPNSSKADTIAAIPNIGLGIPVFVYTGYEEEELLKQSLDAGAADWFLKGDNHRGGSALGGRMAALYYRNRHDTRDRERIVTALFKTRREQANEAPPGLRNKFSTAHSLTALSCVIVVQLIALFWFIWNQAGANALFRKQVADNTAAIGVLQAKAETFHDQNQHSIEDRSQINKRVDDAIANYSSLRTDMNNGFQRIYDILLADRKTNAENRQADQHSK